MNDIVRDIFSFADYSESEYPALANQIREWRMSRPLAGIKILDATPVFRNTTLKYAALIEAGAELTVAFSNVMPFDPKAVEFVKSCDIPVATAEDRPLPQDIILDCAGAFAAWKPRLGISELTRSGAHHYTSSPLPVFLADEGRIKRIETCLGTGDGCFRALAQSGHTEWKQKRIIVFGSGKVGTGIIRKAVSLGAVVDVVTDPSTVTEYVKSRVRKVIDFKDSGEIESVLTDSSLIVTATGIKGALEKCCSANAVLASGALLANLGVEDEFGNQFPASAVLNEKRPLNFILTEPTQMRYIEGTMALHNEGALRILSGTLKPGINTPPAEVEERLLAVIRRNGLITDELDYC